MRIDDQPLSLTYHLFDPQLLSAYDCYFRRDKRVQNSCPREQRVADLSAYIL